VFVIFIADQESKKGSWVRCTSVSQTKKQTVIAINTGKL